MPCSYSLKKKTTSFTKKWISRSNNAPLGIFHHQVKPPSPRISYIQLSNWPKKPHGRLHTKKMEWISFLLRDHVVGYLIFLKDIFIYFTIWVYYPYACMCTICMPSMHRRWYGTEDMNINGYWELNPGLLQS